MRLADLAVCVTLLYGCDRTTKREPPEYFTDKAVKNALNAIMVQWKSDYPNRCPTAAELVAQRYVSVANDGWGHDLRIICTHGTDDIIVASDGKDGKPGTADDVVVHWSAAQEAADAGGSPAR
jgi:hypothetical protein